MRDQGAINRKSEIENRKASPRYAIVARASAAGVIFPLSIVAGYLLGNWLGKAVGWGDAPALVGAMLGAAAGFWNLYRLLRALDSGGKRF